MSKGVAKGYKIPDEGCWALEYASRVRELASRADQLQKRALQATQAESQMKNLANQKQAQEMEPHAQNPHNNNEIGALLGSWELSRGE